MSWGNSKGGAFRSDQMGKRWQDNAKYVQTPVMTYHAVKGESEKYIYIYIHIIKEVR